MGQYYQGSGVCPTDRPSGTRLYLIDHHNYTINIFTDDAFLLADKINTNLRPTVQNSLKLDCFF